MSYEIKPLTTLMIFYLLTGFIVLPILGETKTLNFSFSNYLGSFGYLFDLITLPLIISTSNLPDYIKIPLIIISAIWYLLIASRIVKLIPFTGG